MSLHIPKEDKEALYGVIDIHVHVADISVPAYDEVKLAEDARAANYGGLYIMANAQDNSQHLHTIRKLVPGIGLWGGPILNLYSGGLNPFAVEAGLIFGAKEVKFSNFHTRHQFKFLPGRPSTRVHKPRVFEKAPKVTQERAITILDEDGKLVPEVYEILDLIAEADIIVGTGHLSLKEIYVLVEEARKTGVKKILVTHPHFDVTRVPIEDQVKLAGMGAVMEICFEQCQPYRGEYGFPPTDPAKMDETIRKVGVDKCVMATDVGELHVPHPIETMRTFIRTMKFFDITDQQIDVMTKDNPARLLGVD